MAFANTVFHKKAILLIFEAEVTESMLEIILYTESNMGPPWLGSKKVFQNRSSRFSFKNSLRRGTLTQKLTAGKRYVEQGFHE